MIVVVIDVLFDSCNFECLVKWVMFGLVCIGGIVFNGSGDYVIVFFMVLDLCVFYWNEGRMIE